jgi:hypothetical protein
MLGISTCWWARKRVKGKTLVQEAVDMGFHGIELEYRVTERLFQEMKPFLGKQVRIMSVHNVFPRLKFSPALTLGKIDNFSKVSIFFTPARKITLSPFSRGGPSGSCYPRPSLARNVSSWQRAQRGSLHQAQHIQSRQ